MACVKMLVLCGPTYPVRLWCAWELCTLTSFIGVASAAKRVEIVMLNSDSSNFSAFFHFDVGDAHCFDPNEEAKLMTVIDVVGRDQFNHKVRSLASACQAQRTRAKSFGSRLSKE